MPQQTKTFRVFVSSTFTDMKEERRILQNEVFPKLEKFCEENGAKFQAVDLRWGINEQSQLNQKTLDICLSEIVRCQKISPKPNFIVLIGDKYGWQPIPTKIPFVEMHKILEVVSPEQDSLLKKWYFCDENAVPAEYILQPIGPEYREYSKWEPIERDIREILRSAVVKVSLPKEKIDKYFSSATHQEILAGALNPPNTTEGQEGHAFVFVRHIDGLPNDKSAEGYLDFVDNIPDLYSAKQLVKEKHDLKEKLKDHYFNYEARWQNGITRIKDRNGFADKVFNLLNGIIQDQIKDIHSVEKDKQEIKLHEKFKEDLTKHFIGRSSILKEIMNYLYNPSIQLVLSLVGDSGSGKSSIMAQTAKLHEESNLSAVTVYRFIGITSRSSNALTLLLDICEQIAREFGESLESLAGENADKMLYEIQGLSEIFIKCLALGRKEKPITVLLDALDQFSDTDDSHSLFWIPNKLPANAKIIVSTLTSESKFLCQTETLQIPVLPRAEAGQVLEKWLRANNRLLTKKQYEKIITKFTQNGLPIYLKLAFECAKHWHSYDTNNILQSDVKGILNDFFQFLEEEHTEEFVRTVISYILCGKYQGLAENEILELLFFDEKHRKIFIDRTHKDHREELEDATRIPIAVWSRFFFDIEPFLSERDADGVLIITFYHRQFVDVLKERYKIADNESKKSKSYEYHKTLTEYFTNKPLYLDGTEIARPNTRKLVEQPWQQTKKGRLTEVTDTLCDIEFMDAKAHAGMVYELQADYQFAIDSLSGAQLERVEKQSLTRIEKYTNDLISYANGQIEKIDIIEFIKPKSINDIESKKKEIVERPSQMDRLNHFYQFVRTHLHALLLYGRMYFFLIQQAYNFANSDEVAKAAESVLSNEERVPLLLLAPFNRKPMNPFLIRTLEGHKGRINDVSMTPDGRVAVSASDDCTIRLWDLHSGRGSMILRGHQGSVNSVAISPDGLYALSGSSDNTLMFWDLHTGNCITVLNGHKKAILTVAITPNMRIAISGGRDEVIKVWDIEKNVCINELNHHDHFIQALHVSLDGKKAFSVGGNERILEDLESVNYCIWDLKSGECINEYAGPLSGFTSISVTPDGTKAILGSKVKMFVPDFSEKNLVIAQKKPTVYETISIWDSSKEDSLRKIFGNNEVNSVAMSPDGRIAIFGCDIFSIKKGILGVFNTANDEELKLWQGHQQRINSLKMTPDGKTLVSASDDATLKIWNLEEVILSFAKGKHPSFINNVRKHPTIIDNVHITLDSKKAIGLGARDSSLVWDDSVDRWAGTSSRGDNFYVWDIEKGKQQSIFQDYIGMHPVSLITTNNNLHIFTKEPDSEVGPNDAHGLFIFSLKDGRCIKSILHKKIGGVKRASISLDGRLAVIWCLEGVGGKNPGGRSSLKLIDQESGNCLNEIIQGNMGDIGPVLISPDGKLMFCVAKQDNIIIVWNICGSKLHLTLHGHENSIDFINITPDGRYLITGGYRSNLRVWDLRSAKCQKILIDKEEGTIGCAITPDCRFVISGNRDKTIRIWSIVDGKCLAIARAEEPLTAISEIRAKGFFACVINKQECLQFFTRNINMGIPVVTASQTWIYAEDRSEGRWSGVITATCQWCGHIFQVPKEILHTISTISKAAGILEDQPPSLALSNADWDTPTLISKCNYCERNIKFNPFVNDNISIFNHNDNKNWDPHKNEPIAMQKTFSNDEVRTDIARHNPNVELEKRINNYYRENQSAPCVKYRPENINCRERSDAPNSPNEAALKEFKIKEKKLREGNDKKGLQKNLSEMIELYYNNGDFNKALKLLQEEELLCRELGDKNELQLSLGNRAMVLQNLDKLEEAMELFKEQEKICRELGNKYDLQLSLGNQALILRDWGNFRKAIELHKEEEQLCRSLRNQEDLKISLNNQKELLYVWIKDENTKEILSEAERIFGAMKEKDQLKKFYNISKNKYRRDLATWKSLPWWKRVVYKKPEIPFGKPVRR